MANNELIPRSRFWPLEYIDVFSYYICAYLSRCTYIGCLYLCLHYALALVYVHKCVKKLVHYIDYTYLHFINFLSSLTHRCILIFFHCDLGINSTSLSSEQSVMMIVFGPRPFIIGFFLSILIYTYLQSI